MAQANVQTTGNPMVILIEACKADDVSLMERALKIASQELNSRYSVQDLLQRGLKRAAARDASRVLKYVLDRGIDVATLSADEIMTNDVPVEPSREVLETLIAYGWDINTRGPCSTSWPLLWYVVQYPDLVRWCLDHGANVDIPEDTGRPGPTILGMAALSGTTETFELLRTAGAPLDPLTLHYAVDQATMSAPVEGSDHCAAYTRRMDMVRHLVDALKLNVNPVKHQAGTQCSTPLCFVARRGTTGQDFRDLVFFLLDHGADLNLDGGTLEGHHWPNPVTCAESSGNSNFLRSVEEWKARDDNTRNKTSSEIKHKTTPTTLHLLNQTSKAKDMCTFTISPITTPDDLASTIKLFKEYATSLNFNLCFQNFDTEMASMPGKYAPPEGALLLARKDSTGEAIGCVGLRALSSDICEMKRLYVAPAGRGTGVGKALTLAVIAEAGRLGYQAMRLDTLPTMNAALKLYSSLGFVEIGAYYATPLEGTVFLELPLSR